MVVFEKKLNAANQGTRKDRRIETEIVPVSSLASQDVSSMFNLYAAYYDAITVELFEHDLADKQWALILRDTTGALVGFSTIAVLNVMSNDVDAQVIYSGDTIIDRAYWGSQALSFAWIRFTGSIKAMAPRRPLYWFLIVKGHRTYRYLSAFSINFFPHWSVPTPRWARDIMDDLAMHRFGEAYHPERGVVSFSQSRGHLKGEWASIDPDEKARSDVAFFLRRNPGYVHGDELVCLTELAPENLRPIARRVFLQGMRG